MERPHPGRAMLAGFVATLAMTMLMYGGPMMGMPKMDVAAMLGSMLGGGMPGAGTGAWWAGMVAHFINGSIIFPLVYVYALFGVLPGPPWVKGVTLGAILWALSQALMMPMMGMGFFSANAPQPMLGVAGSLIGHLVYGGIFGGVAGGGRQRAATIPREQRRGA